MVEKLLMYNISSLRYNLSGKLGIEASRITRKPKKEQKVAHMVSP
jgi:hypothetical protein